MKTDPGVTQGLRGWTVRPRCSGSLRGARARFWHWRHGLYRALLRCLWRHEYGGWDPVEERQNDWQERI